MGVGWGTTGRCGGRGRKGRRRGGGVDPDDTMWVSGAPGCGKGRRAKREEMEQAIRKDEHEEINANNGNSSR